MSFSLFSLVSLKSFSLLSAQLTALLAILTRLLFVVVVNLLLKELKLVFDSVSVLLLVFVELELFAPFVLLIKDEEDDSDELDADDDKEVIELFNRLA